MFCSHCGKGDQPVDTYCKGCGKYLYNPSLLRRRDTPPDVIAWMMGFSLCSFLMGIAAALSIFLHWRESPIIFAFLFFGAMTGQITNIWLGIRLRQRLTRSRREFAEDPGQMRIEYGASPFIETNIGRTYDERARTGAEG